jgi:hypothetical protein
MNMTARQAKELSDAIRDAQGLLLEKLSLKDLTDDISSVFANPTGTVGRLLDLPGHRVPKRLGYNEITKINDAIYSNEKSRRKRLKDSANWLFSYHGNEVARSEITEILRDLYRGYAKR